MSIEIEKIANSLKGVASVLSTMGEVPEGSMKWNEWALYLLYKELDENIRKLEELANCEDDEENDESGEEQRLRLRILFSFGTKNVKGL